MELQVLEKEALLLPDMERALLADRLLASLSAGSDALRQKWVAEAESRFQAYQSGAVPALDGPSTMAALRTRFSR